MRLLIIEIKRMLFEKKLLWFVGSTIIYMTICSMFFNLRFRLDYGHANVCYNMSAFKLWQDTMDKIIMMVLMQIVPPMIYVISFMEDRKNGIDIQICVRNNNNRYYATKYTTVIMGGMLYNFLSVILMYFPLHFLLSTGGYKWNHLDREYALVGKYFTGNTAMEFVLLIAMACSLTGGICAAMSYVISLWIDNRVLVCIIPYIVFKILNGIQLFRRNSPVLFKIIAGNVDICMIDQPIRYYVYHFIFWLILLSSLLTISYIIKIKKKR